jgi:hypothetical protein
MEKLQDIESDPDTLQLKDELDFKWVGRWRKAVKHKKCSCV